jgi:hypothetical protein
LKIITQLIIAAQDELIFNDAHYLKQETSQPVTAAISPIDFCVEPERKG